MVIGVNGEKLGVLDLETALQLAKKHKVDLVEISPNTEPPVAKLIDWGKYQYQKMKKQQKSRKNSKTSEIKQMNFGLKIGDNDLKIKLKKVASFLEKGHKVRLVVTFRGREMAHTEIGYEIMDKIIGLLGDNVIIEQKPQMNGRNLSVNIRSK